MVQKPEASFIFGSRRKLFMNKKEKGNAGEQIAADYLIKEGYTLLKKNWRYKHGELDIIAQKNDQLIFAEVKTRNSRSYVNNNAYVKPCQRKSILNTANYFLQYNISHNVDIRFDILCLFQVGNSFEINHIQNAFFPALNDINY